MLLLAFAGQQIGQTDLLPAVCIVKVGCWREVGEMRGLAGECGNCQLPVSLSAADWTNSHARRHIWPPTPRVLTQLKMATAWRHTASHQGRGRLR
mmetsp:Transcript_40028/g.114024  ORF Transcript_40028/g.114024 Transcript_40028/m.114024 type:complete len:95 (-) Transcript_40028:2814-3098(-)